MGILDFEEPFLRLYNQGIILGEDHEKMSKSRGNVVNPDEVVDVMGADAVRCYLMFIGPWDQGGPWSEVGINGVARWLNRVWDILGRDASDLDAPDKASFRTAEDGDSSRETLRLLHQTIRRCHNDLDRFKFNTAIAGLMELSNHLNRVWTDSSVDSGTWRECVEKFLLMLAPIAPHVSEEMWERSGHPYSIHQQAFPTWDDDLAAEETITLVVQVNGRVRDRIEVPAGIEEEAAMHLAMTSPRIQSHTEGKSIANTIYVPGRLVNIVVK
jgi:leucyl-tRNA synthetase